MMLAVTGVLSVSAQTPQYGKPYKPYGRSNHEVVQQQAQMPSAVMYSTGSGMMNSGSTLPQAAATGAVVTGSKLGTYSPASGHHGNMRRDVGGGGSTDDDDEDPDLPVEPNPIGDALLPLMVMAMGFGGVIYLRRKRA